MSAPTLKPTQPAGRRGAVVRRLQPAPWRGADARARRALRSLAGLWVLMVGGAAGAQAQAPAAGAGAPGIGPAGVVVGEIVQVIGQARLGGEPARLGDLVIEGQTLSTGADGYLYLRTADRGFLILRPQSTMRVPSYRVDTEQPARSRFKFELEGGVARSISGRAVPAARQNFRFNTPVAAIGVVGTDFTVYTDAQTTRVAVTSGGVVVSGFGQGCSAEGSGPCDNPTRQLLLASQAGQVLQVNRGSVAPQLLQGGTLAPDTLAPPRSDEPTRISSGVPPESLTPLKMAALDEAQRVAAALPPAVLWGRWQSIADRPATLDLVHAMKDASLMGLNGHFAVLRARGAPWVMPQEAAVTFQLKGFDAQIQAPGGILPAGLEQARLSVDFTRRTFSTGFDLVLPGGERVARQADGVVDAAGRFSSSSLFLVTNSMTVAGVAGQPGPGAGLQAGYVFQSRIDADRLAAGVTFWGR